MKCTLVKPFRCGIGKFNVISGGKRSFLFLGQFGLTHLTLSVYFLLTASFQYHISFSIYSDFVTFSKPKWFWKPWNIDWILNISHVVITAVYFTGLAHIRERLWLWQLIRLLIIIFSLNEMIKYVNFSHSIRRIKQYLYI